MTQSTQPPKASTSKASPLRGRLLFFQEFFREFTHTGTMFPTSKYAAHALTEALRDRTTPLKVLEIGPGTGSVTLPILEQLQAGDSLTICEINPRFMESVKSRVMQHHTYPLHQKNIDFFEGPIQDLPEKQHYDVIVCALPFLNFKLETIKEIFAKLKRMSTDNVVMTHYEYIGLRDLNLSFAPKEQKIRMTAIHDYFTNMFSKALVHRKRVWRNVLPIYVYMMELSKVEVD